MNFSDFQNNPSGSLIPTTNEQFAFVPNDLPPYINRGELFSTFGDTSALMGALNAKIRQVPNPELIIRPLQRLEALASSAMEGTFTTSDELALLEAGAESNARSETIEVRNYFTALSQCTSDLQKLPISHRMIKNAHRTLLGNLPNMRGGNKRPGEYKNEQNWIGGRTISQARFVPPPPREALLAMDKLETFVNRLDTTDIEPLLEAALVHYQFETIHPFADGNGRVGRMLIPIMLLAREQITLPIFYPSAVMEQRKDEYIDKMYSVSSQSSWTDWLVFFLKMSAETCENSISIIDKLLKLNTDYKERAMQLSRSHNPLTLIDSLFIQPVVTAPMARDYLGITLKSARSTIGVLQEAGIVRKIPGLNMPEYFLAGEILNVTA